MNDDSRRNVEWEGVATQYKVEKHFQSHFTKLRPFKMNSKLCLMLVVLYLVAATYADNILAKLLARNQQRGGRSRVGKFSGAGDLDGWSWGSQVDIPTFEEERLENMERTLLEKLQDSGNDDTMEEAPPGTVVKGQKWAEMFKALKSK